MEESYFARKEKRTDLWWISDERFKLLEDYRKDQLLDPSRVVTLPDADVTNHILNNAAQVVDGTAVLIERGLRQGKPVDSQMVGDLKDHWNIIWNFLKAYGIVN